jgi:leader peptidase (prepilin peptidase)/N-methyltransferase
VTAIIVIGLSFLAGWAVNVMADALPAAQPPAGSWRQPLDAVSRLLRGGALPGDRMHAWRTLLVWGAALIAGWLAFRRFGMSAEALVVAVYAWFFLAVAVIDLEHRRVLNRMLLAALPFALAASLLLHNPPPLSAVAGTALGFGVFLLLALVRPGGMGMGDVKLAGLIGLMTGLDGVILAMTVGILAGGLAALALLASRRFDRKATMAYAPYLALGAWVALYFGADLWRAYLA